MPKYYLSILIPLLALLACSSDDSTTSAPTADSGTPDSGPLGPTDSGLTDSPAEAEADAAAPPACALTSSCTAIVKSCVGLVDNTSAAKRGLRMNQIDLKTPAGLGTASIQSKLAAAAGLHDPGCTLAGTGTWSWLLQLDTTAGTIKTGGAKPAADPTAGYSFDDETLGAFHVQAATLTTPLALGAAFDAATGADVVMPVFLDTATNSVLVLPIRQLRLKGTLSADGSCIGAYNASGLDPVNMCQADSTHPSFVDGGSGSGFITLEDADNSIVSVLNESLCVLLSGDAATYGDGGSPQKCKRTGGVITFAGDWCSTTNAAGGCKDSVALGFDYAASSIQINN